MRCEGNIELERKQALRDWYTLIMGDGADIVEYGRKSVKLREKITSIGVPVAQRPLRTGLTYAKKYSSLLSNSLVLSSVLFCYVFNSALLLIVGS